MTMLKDASSNSTSFLYDADNRLTSQTDQLGHTGTMAYDAIGRQTSVTDRDGRIRNYFYDAVGHVTGQTWYTTGGTSVTANITMLYDAAGKLTLAAANYGAYTMMYDALDRVTVAQEPFNPTLTMGYDAAAGRRKQSSPPKTVALWPCDLGASSASQVASMLLARGRPKGILALLLGCWPSGPVTRSERRAVFLVAARSST